MLLGLCARSTWVGLGRGDLDRACLRLSELSRFVRPICLSAATWIGRVELSPCFGGLCARSIWVGFWGCDLDRAG